MADSLPFKDLLPDAKIVTKDISLMQTWSVKYPDTSDHLALADDVASRMAVAFQRFSEDFKTNRTAFWFTLQRLPNRLSVDDESSGCRFMETADKEIERRRNDNYTISSTNHINYNYVSMKVKVRTDTMGNMTTQSVNHAESMFRDFETIMYSIGARMRRMKCDDSDPELNIMSFMKYMASIEFNQYKCPKEGMNDISSFVSCLPIYKGHPMLVGDESHGEYFMQAMTINAFPEETFANILRDLQEMNFPFRWVTRWKPRTNAESIKIGEKRKQKNRENMKSLNTIVYEQTSGKESDNINVVAAEGAAGAEESLIDVAHGETYGELTSTIVLYSRTLERLYEMVKETKAVVNACGFDVLEHNENSNFFAWLGTIPGNDNSMGRNHNRREYIITASNFADIVPFCDFYHGSPWNWTLGEKTGVYYPHAIGTLPSREFYYLNLNGGKGQLGHTFIIGDSDQGKSTLLAFLASQWGRYPNSRVILFDKDQSFRNLCDRDGGAVYIPGSGAGSLQLMPLARMKTDPASCQRWLEVAIDATAPQGRTIVDPQIRNELSYICTQWPDDLVPTVEEFVNQLSGYNANSEALPALRTIMSNRELAYLFGGREDNFDAKTLRRKTMFEMRYLMDMGEHAVVPALHFIFTRLKEILRQNPQPTLLMLDEAWAFLKHDLFKAEIDDWLNTLRKFDVYVVMALLHLTDINDAEQFMKECKTKIFLPSPVLKHGSDAIKQLYRNAGLNDWQIHTLGEAIPKREYLISQNEGTALVCFDLDAYQLERLTRTGK